MTVETDALAEAALRFSEAVRAERTSTMDALSTERQATLKIIEALRAERGRRTTEASGRFVFGVAMGVALGIAVIYVVNQRASEEARLGLTAGPVGSVGDDPGGALNVVRDRLRAAIEDGKRAASVREGELWQRYRERIAQPPQRDEPPY
jgi:hypothetical protein